MVSRITFFVCAMVLASQSFGLTAEIGLNRMLTAGAVLQRGDAVINGTAPQGSTVTVSFPCDDADETSACSCTVGPNCPYGMPQQKTVGAMGPEGYWLVELSLPDADAGGPADDPAGHRLNIHIDTSEAHPNSTTGCADSNGFPDTNVCNIYIPNVLVGEVWICAGQSGFMSGEAGSSADLCPSGGCDDLFPFVRLSANDHSSGANNDGACGSGAGQLPVEVRPAGVSPAAEFSTLAAPLSV